MRHIKAPEVVPALVRDGDRRLSDPAAEHVCKAAQTLIGRVFNRAELLDLPLKGCNKRCGCTYIAKM